MSRKNGLEGLARWAERDDWAELFDEVFDRHFGDLLDAYDVDFEALDEIIGADNADMLWAWALEDFATLPRPEDGLTVVDDYLKRRGWKEGPTNRRMLEALRDSVVGFYEVSAVEPRRAVTLVDLVFEDAPLPIDDPVLAGAFRTGDRFAGRVVEIAGTGARWRQASPRGAKRRPPRRRGRMRRRTMRPGRPACAGRTRPARRRARLPTRRSTPRRSTRCSR
jgi:hypothetical protein